VSEPQFLTDARAFYDAMAVDYEAQVATDLATYPVERSVLRLFADLVGPAAEVLDAGCGPGHVTAFLAGLGLRARGLDLTPTMVEMARAAHPRLRFDLGSVTALDLADASLDGVLLWYSLIHVPPAVRPAVLRECHRVLRPGGHLLIAFQVGTEPRHVVAPDGRRYDDGRPVALDFHRISPDALWDELRNVRFVRVSSTVRAPAGAEATDQASLIARRD
jgi:SAM-dependent methyltransferase